MKVRRKLSDRRLDRHRGTFKAGFIEPAAHGFLRAASDAVTRSLVLPATAHVKATASPRPSRCSARPSAGSCRPAPRPSSGCTEVPVALSIADRSPRVASTRPRRWRKPPWNGRWPRVRREIQSRAVAFGIVAQPSRNLGRTEQVHAAPRIDPVLARGWPMARIRSPFCPARWTAGCVDVDGLLDVTLPSCDPARIWSRPSPGRAVPAELAVELFVDYLGRQHAPGMSETDPRGTARDLRASARRGRREDRRRRCRFPPKS